MNCYYCKGANTMEQKSTRFCAYDIEAPFIMENVPASVCRLCGEKSYTDEVVSALEKIRNGEAQVSGFQTFRVFDFRNLDKVDIPESVWIDYYRDNPWAHKVGSSLLLDESGVESGQTHPVVFVSHPALTLSADSESIRSSRQFFNTEPNHWPYPDPHQRAMYYRRSEDASVAHVHLVARL